MNVIESSFEPSEIEAALAELGLTWEDLYGNDD